MTINRKEFFRKACISGACMCGFGALGASADIIQNQPDDTEKQMFREWLSTLLSGLNENDEATKAAIKSAAIAHYNNLKMDEMLAPYVGDMDKFIGFISEKWGWKSILIKPPKPLLRMKTRPIAFALFYPTIQKIRYRPCVIVPKVLPGKCSRRFMGRRLPQV